MNIEMVLLYEAYNNISFIDYFSPRVPFDYDPPPGGFVNNDETEYNQVTWNDARNQPSWSVLLQDQYQAETWFSTWSLQETKQDQADVLDEISLFPDWDAMKSDMEGDLLPIGISDVTGLQTALDGKFSTPSGTTAQYVRGNGTLATFPTIPASYYDLTTKPAAKSFDNVASRTIQTVAAAGNGWRLSTFRDARVSYNVTVTASVQIGVVSNVGGYVVLEVAATNSSTASDWKEVSRVGNSQNVGLAVALSLAQGVTGTLSADVPAGYYVRMRSVNSNGTPTFTYHSGQEVLDEPLQVAA